MNVVFDFGGVLLRWQPHEFMPRLLLQHPATAEAATALVADFFQGFGGDWAEFDRGTIDAGSLAVAIARRTGLPFADVTRVIGAIPAELQPMAASMALLDRLKARGHRLFYLSNMPEPYARHVEAMPGFLTPFERGVFSARVGHIKPEPAIYALAIQTFEIAPAETVFIDDMAKNVAAAQAVGWQAFRFDGAEGCEIELRRRGLL